MNTVDNPGQALLHFRFRPIEALGRMLYHLGRPVVSHLAESCRIVAVTLAVIYQSLRPLTWRRPARMEFVRQCHMVGPGNLMIVCVLGLLVGIGLVFQALYWLEMAGQRELISQFLVLVLIREIAPLLVAVVMIGRSGAAITAELAAMRSDGQVRSLDALGLDPLLVLVVPRAAAMSICLPCLTVVFLVVAIGSGYMAANALQIARHSPGEFVSTVLAGVALSAYAAVALKTVLTGLLIGVICCRRGLNTASTMQVAREVPRGFAQGLLAAFIVSGVITLLK